MEDKKKPEVKPAPKPIQPEIPVGLTKQIDEVIRRLRLLEERNSSLRKKSQFTEQNLLKDTKEIYEEINVLKETVSELKNEISEMNEKMAKFSEEVSNSVKKTDFNTLSKYIDYWQPLNFLTKEDAEKLLRETKQ